MGRRSLTARGIAVCVCLAAASLAWASAASADTEFCEPGGGAGQCAAPSGLRGLALDHNFGLLYVADQANNRVNVFEKDGEGGMDFLFAFGWGVDTGAAALEECTEASGCQPGLAGPGFGQLATPSKVVVDNDPLSTTYRDVWVVDSNFRVQRFETTGAEVEAACEIGDAQLAEAEKFKETISIGVGSGGVLHVLDNLSIGGNQFKHRLQRFKPGCAPVEPALPQCVLFEAGRARSLAVDSAGNAWVVNQGAERGIRKYDAGCTLLFLAGDSAEKENLEVVLDEAGNPFAAQREEGEKAAITYRVIAAYDPTSGAIERRYGYDRIPVTVNPEGLAVAEEDEGGVFVSIGNAGTGEAGIKRLDHPSLTPALPPPGPIATPSGAEVLQIGSAKAKAIAEINPEGEETVVRFEYLTEVEYEAQGESFVGPATKSTDPEPLGASGVDLKAFEGEVGCPDPANEATLPESPCLKPETTYRWRVIATNSDGAGEGTAEGPPFTTIEAPTFGEIWSTAVGSDTAKLHGELNPTSIPAFGWFEYVEEAAYLKDLDEGGDGFAAASQEPDVDGGEAPLSFGAGEGFFARRATVHPLSPATAYRYRVVADTPLSEPVAGQEVGRLQTFAAAAAGPPCPNDAFRIGPGVFLPDCRAYEMVSPPDKEGGDIQVLTDGLGSRLVLEQGDEAGEKLAYGSIRAFADAVSAPATSQYVAERIPDGDGEYDEGEGWRTHSVNPPRGRPLAGVVTQVETEFKYFSPDLCEGWQRTFAEPPLAPGGVPGYFNLYRRSDGLCGEDGKVGYEALAPIVEPELPEIGIAFQGASADGSHAVFMADGKLHPEASTAHQAYESVGGGAPQPVCRLPGGEVAAGSCTAGSALSLINIRAMSLKGAISEDGGRIFFSVLGAGTGPGEIYLRSGGTQTIAVSKEGEEETAGTGKSWFWGAAEDGSRAIFGTATTVGGIADLYAFEPEDEPAEQSEKIAGGVLGVMGMSDDATRVYFLSEEAIPGSGQNSEGAEAQIGEPNLYLHEAGEGGGSTLFVARLADGDVANAVDREPLQRTAKVSPDGLHAAFTSLTALTAYDNRGAASGAPTREIYRWDAAAGELLCASCNPTGARPAGPATLPPFSTGLHAPRALSEDGDRIFFASADVLAARDSNGRVDVYQWEEAGTGDCTEGTASFSADAQGCIDLISSGQGSQDSRFVEADPDGNNVFFATVSSLLPQDSGVIDIYDAREGGGLPVPPIPVPPCEGDACRAPVGAPAEEAPASEAYAPPAGEPVATKPKRRCAKGKRRVNRKGKSRCVAKRKQSKRGERRAAR